jgi:hypothetical protein
MVPMLTREQIEEWREWFMDPAPWPSEQQRVAAINALCDMALSSLPSGVMTKTVPVEPTGEMRDRGADRMREVTHRLNAHHSLQRQVAWIYEAMLAAAPEAAPHQNAGVDINKLVDRFLSWPLPESVCSDLTVTFPGRPHRTGTNLLTAIEAKQMLEHVLAGAAPRVGEDEVIERCAKLIEEHYWDSFQNDRRLDAHVKSLAKMIRALKSKQEGDNAALPPDVPPSDGALVRVNDKG